ncbi:uncharacterized protein LOC120557332 [Perca fluviatilis]|uniref:uncharacterized protein LOC120557332 n=1 Tax=Perca fluviatilis TaxID=8168 RepID=UPI0019634AAA|nr:uncharacterized protein LOC120557332 [Perca fluviatilis]
MTTHTWFENTIWGGMCALFKITNSYNHRRRLRKIYNEVLQEQESQGVPTEERKSDMEPDETEDAEQIPPEIQSPDLETSHHQNVEEECLPKGVITDTVHVVVTDEEDDEQEHTQSPDLETSHHQNVEEECLPKGVITDTVHVVVTDEEDDEQEHTQSPDLETSHHQNVEEECLPKGVITDTVHVVVTDEEDDEQEHTQSPDLEETLPLNTPTQQQEKLYCLCRQPNYEHEPYVECKKCKDWFHPFCVGARTHEDLEWISPWFCPNCSSQPPKKPKKAARRLFSKQESIEDKEICDRDERREDTDSNTSSPEVSSRSDSSDECCPECYQIPFSRAEWEDIKPVDTEKGTSGHLGGTWWKMHPLMNGFKRCCRYTESSWEGGGARGKSLGS